MIQIIRIDYIIQHILLGYYANRKLLLLLIYVYIINTANAKFKVENIVVSVKYVLISGFTFVEHSTSI